MLIGTAARTARCRCAGRASLTRLPIPSSRDRRMCACVWVVPSLRASWYPHLDRTGEILLNLVEFGYRCVRSQRQRVQWKLTERNQTTKHLPIIDCYDSSNHVPGLQRCKITSQKSGDYRMMRTVMVSVSIFSFAFIFAEAAIGNENEQDTKRTLALALALAHNLSRMQIRRMTNLMARKTWLFFRSSDFVVF